MYSLKCFEYNVTQTLVSIVALPITHLGSVAGSMVTESSVTVRAKHAARSGRLISSVVMSCLKIAEGRKEMFYLTTHSTHFSYSYMASDIWKRTIQIVRKETRCRHMGYSFRLTARVLLYASSHRKDSTHHGLSYTSRGTLGGSIRRPIAS